MTNYQQISKLPLLVISESLIFADRQAYAFQTLISAHGDLEFGHRFKRRFFFSRGSQGSLIISRSRSREIQNQCSVRGKINNRFCCYCRYKTRAGETGLQVWCWLQQELRTAATKIKSKENWQQIHCSKYVCHEPKSKRLGFFLNFSSCLSKAFPHPGTGTDYGRIKTKNVSSVQMVCTRCWPCVSHGTF